MSTGVASDLTHLRVRHGDARGAAAVQMVMRRSLCII
jgi:hypothetical protein